MIAALLLFVAAALVLAGAGQALIRAADAIGASTGLGRAFVGMVIVATVTSLPELSTGISAVTVVGAPDIAVGDVVGSCVFNLLLFALADACSPGIAFYGRLRTTHNLTAAFGVIVLGALVLAILAPDTAQVSIGHVGVYSLVLALLYLGAARLLFEVDVQARTAPGAGAAPATPLRAAMMTCALTAVAVMLAGLLLAFSAEQIAQRLALADSFVGAMLVAAATSLPEAMTTLAAVRQRAYDIAAGNLLGSNLFNVVVLAIEDVAYLPGPLLADASNVLAAPAVTAMIMTAVIIGALNYVRRTTPRPVDIWVGFALIGLYGFNAWLMFSAAR